MLKDFPGRYAHLIDFAKKYELSEALQQKIATLDPVSIEKFIDDFDGDAAAIQFFEGNVERVKAWDDLFDFPNIRINPTHLEAYDVFKATNNVTPKVTKDEILEALNDLGSEADQVFI